MTIPSAFATAWSGRAAAACALIAAVGAADAASFTFSGRFAQDDDVALYKVTLDAPATLDLRSLGYGGGVDTNGATRAAGGFDTMAFLFNASGVLVAQSDDGLSALTDPVTGLAADAGFAIALGAGSYTLALTQYDNVPVGSLSEGFSRAGAGNFTPGLAAGCTAAAFCDWTGAARNDQWVLAFDGASTVAPVPEPAAWALMLAGLGTVLLRRRRTVAP